MIYWHLLLAVSISEMEIEDSHEGVLPFNSHDITQKLKKVAEVELNEKESEVENALNDLKDHLKSRCWNLYCENMKIWKNN